MLVLLSIKFDDGEEVEEEDKVELRSVLEAPACTLVAAPCAEKIGVLSPIGTTPILLVRT